VGRLGEDQLGDARPGFELDGVVDFEQPLAPALVAGVPDGRIQHTGVAQQRRPGVEKAHVSLGDDHAVAVLDDVAAPIERVDAVVGLEFAALANRLAVPPDTTGLDLLVHRAQRQVDAVWLDLCRRELVESLGHEPSAFEHTVAGTATAKTLPFEP